MNTLNGQQTSPLYPGQIPNSKKSPNEEKDEMVNGVRIISKISIPEITVFRPANGKSNHAAVIIFPGGGYWTNAMSHEGTDVARKFNEWGVTAFVVKYRIPNERTMINPTIGPLQDAQEAMMRVRSESNKWGIDSNRIGIMGFSAGGHLASTLGTHFRQSLVDNPRNISLRPDFMILGYPVISTDSSISHKGSFEQLIGKHPGPELLRAYSNELQIDSLTPPTFLVHASDDDVVPVQNAIVFYENLIKKGVHAEMHLYKAGGHGFGMNNPTTSDKWMERVKNWMISEKFIK